MPRILTLTPNPTCDFAVEADFVEPNRKLRCKSPDRHAGGGGLNVARAASRLGAEVLAIFPVGGLFGEMLIELVEKENIPTRTIAAAGETRLAFHVYDRKEGDEYRFNFPGATMSAEERDLLLDALEQETKIGDYVVGSGSLPPGDTADMWARAARVARKKGARFVLDSVSGLDAALNEGVFLLRQNKTEYQALAGEKLAWPKEVAAFAAKIVSDGGAERVAITHGSDGSVMAGPNGAVTAPTLATKTQSAVGAGDSFVAALIVALMKGWSDKDSLRYGAAAAAATRLSPGTSLFEAADVERLFAAPPGKPRR